MSHPTQAANVVQTFEENDTRYIVVETDAGYHLKINTETDFEKVWHPAGFKAAFDLTRMWGRDTWRELMRDHNLVRAGDDATADDIPNDTSIDPPTVTVNDDYSEYVFYGPDLVIRTTCDPFTGKYANDHKGGDHTERKAYCGYIHITGEEDAVRAAHEHICENSNYKEESLGWFCV